MRWFPKQAIVLAALFVGMHAAADGLVVGGWGVVKQVVDGDTLVLEGGLSVRLVGIQAPKLPLWRKGFEEQPLAREAKSALEELTLGQPVRLSYGGLERDRHGRALAHLYDEDGRWIQGEMLRRGLARVYSFQDNRALVREILTIEQEARTARYGIWDLPFFAVRGAQELEQYLNRFVIVEGRVAAADEVRGRMYLNFDKDWRTDFTVSVAPGDMRIFRSEGIDLLALTGRRIRVRGWLREFNGPRIDATHSEQIESLEP